MADTPKIALSAGTIAVRPDAEVALGPRLLIWLVMEVVDTMAEMGGMGGMDETG